MKDGQDQLKVIDAFNWRRVTQNYSNAQLRKVN